MGQLKNPEPRILEVQPKKLVGQSIRLSLAENRLAELWKTFRIRAAEIQNRSDGDFISMAVYDSPDYFSDFNPDRLFTRWAAVEVSGFADLPADMQPYTIQGGLYAAFEYCGRPAEFAAAARHIFQVWLPSSAFVLDNREHFEVLGPRYRPDDPDAEETIWIPVRQRGSGVL